MTTSLKHSDCGQRNSETHQQHTRTQTAKVIEHRIGKHWLRQRILGFECSHRDKVEQSRACQRPVQRANDKEMRSTNQMRARTHARTLWQVHAHTDTSRRSPHIKDEAQTKNMRRAHTETRRRKGAPQRRRAEMSACAPTHAHTRTHTHTRAHARMHTCTCTHTHALKVHVPGCRYKCEHTLGNKPKAWVSRNGASRS